MQVYTTSLFMIFALLLLSLLLLNSLRISKAQSREIRDFSILRQTFIDADCNFVWLKDQHLRYVFANKAAASFHHRSIEEMVGCTDSELVDEQIAVSRERVDRQVLSKKVAVSEEYPYGNQVFKATKFPVPLSHGQWGVGAYIRDITGEYNSKKQMEKTLHRNEILVQMMNQEYNSAQDHLDHVLNESLKLTESEYGYIYVYEEESEEFILNSWSDKVLDDCAILNPGRRQKLSLAGLWGEVVRQRQPIIVNDFSQSHLRKKGHPTGHIRLSKFMSVPIIIDGKIIAVVGLANKKENYDNNDVLQISGLMHGVWNSIERKAHRKGLEEANRILRESEAKLQLLLDSTYEGIYGLDLEGNCVLCNRSCLQMLGYDHPDELIGKNMHYLVHHHHKDGTELAEEDCHIYSAFKRGEGVHVDDEVLWRSDGTYFDAEYFSYPQLADGEVVGAVVTFMDISKRKQSEQKIHYLSYHDALTGLHNRRFFEEELQRCDAADCLPISVIMGDVDGLKLTNDVFGHAAGDRLLVRIAELLKGACSPHDIIARWGGDEYAIILPRTDESVAQGIIEKIGINVALECEGGLFGGISLGSATKYSQDENIRNTLQRAEEEMYAAKTLGGTQTNRALIDTALQGFYTPGSLEAEHAEKVGELCRRIGQALGLEEHELHILETAGYLHDVGKMGLNRSLLDKADPLTRRERMHIERHPLIGYRILNMSEETVELAEHVLQHHERWDGKGYPQGLSGEAISNMARIIALAESYHAMTTDLPYRKALSREEAILEIRENAGSQFDPTIAQIFADLLT